MNHEQPLHNSQPQKPASHQVLELGAAGGLISETAGRLQASPNPNYFSSLFR
jgi:hypothetical protein